MIRRIIRFSAENRYLVIAVYAIAIVLAVWASSGASPLDAMPDLSDTQVIVYSRWDRSPDILEDQVTYPIVTALLGAPKVKTMRGFSDFGFSYVYVIFEDGTDIYWARSRVLEYLSKIQPRLPAGREDRTRARRDGRRLGLPVRARRQERDERDRRAPLVPGLVPAVPVQSVPGVAEVARWAASCGSTRSTLNPNRLAAYGVPISKVVAAVRGGNNDVGGRLVEFTGREYMVRGRGYLKSAGDIGEDRRQDERERGRR